MRPLACPRAIHSRGAGQRKCFMRPSRFILPCFFLRVSVERQGGWGIIQKNKIKQKCSVYWPIQSPLCWKLQPSLSRFHRQETSPRRCAIQNTSPPPVPGPRDWYVSVCPFFFSFFCAPSFSFLPSECYCAAFSKWV